MSGIAKVFIGEIVEEGNYSKIFKLQSDFYRFTLKMIENI